MAVATSPPLPASRPPVAAVVLALFKASGAAGLIYQVVWSRELVLVFGNTTQGSGDDRDRIHGRPWLRQPGRRPARRHQPLAAAPLRRGRAGRRGHGRRPAVRLQRAGRAVPRVAEPGRAPGPAGRGPLRPRSAAWPWPPSCRGHDPATTATWSGHAGRGRARLGELYAANTACAMAGTSSAASCSSSCSASTSYLAVALNVAAGLGALLLSRRWEAGPGWDLAADRRGRPARPEVPSAFRPRRRAVLLRPSSPGSSRSALEVLWTRMLAEGTGSSIYIFTTILAIFLLGIALGSFLYRRFSRPDGERLARSASAWPGVGVLAQATVVLGSGMVGHVLFVVRTVVVLLPATVLMGYAFPLAGRLATPSAEAAGGSVGLLYAANTGGSILGSFSAAFILAGTLGTNGSILLLGALNLLPVRGPVRRRPGGPSAAGAASPGRLVAAGLAGLAVLGLVASLADLPVTRTRTQNELLRTGLPVTHAEDELATVDTVGGRPRAGGSWWAGPG